MTQRICISLQRGNYVHTVYLIIKAIYVYCASLKAWISARKGPEDHFLMPKQTNKDYCKPKAWPVTFIILG